MAGEQKICGVVDWGVQPYARACAWQKELVAARKAGATPDLLVLTAHPHVITLGRNASRQNQRLPDAELERRGVEVHLSDRGGDVTYHGPGQLVGYPILDLSGMRKDVVWYVRALEEVLIRAAGEFGAKATRKKAPAGKPRQRRDKRPLYTGVWVGDEKLAAIGVHISRWVTSHGFAFNVTTDLSYFDLIVPCGIADKGVTSLARLLGSPPDEAGELMAGVKAAVIKHFGEVFNRKMHPVAPETLSRAKSRNWEAWVGTEQAAAS